MIDFCALHAVIALVSPVSCDNSSRLGRTGNASLAGHLEKQCGLWSAGPEYHIVFKSTCKQAELTS